MADNTGMDFYESVVEQSESVGETRRRVLEAKNGMELEVQLYGPDRDEIFDQLQRLPDELLDLFTAQDVDDPQQAQAEANEADMLKGLNSDAIKAFESICAAGMRAPDSSLTSHQIQDLCRELDLQVLFPFGVEIIEMSLEEGSEIEDFHVPDSDKSS